MWTIKNFKEIYARYKSSGLPIHDFCSNERITRSRFYYWLKQYRKLPKADVVIESTQPAGFASNHDAGFIPVIITSGHNRKEYPLKEAPGYACRPSAISSGDDGNDNPLKDHRKNARPVKPSASGSFMEVSFPNGTTVCLRGEKDMELVKMLILLLH